jgi:hypothetical protein
MTTMSQLVDQTISFSESIDFRNVILEQDFLNFRFWLIADSFGVRQTCQLSNLKRTFDP